MDSQDKINRVGAIRLGNDYQDIVALDLIVQFLEHPKNFEWIKVEAYDEAKFLDDVYAKLNNGKIIARQVKYAAHSNDYWDWNDLLKNHEGGLSLFQKWFQSWEKISLQGEIEEISLWTNRKAGQKLKISLVNGSKAIVEKIEKTIWEEIIKQCGTDAKAQEFLSLFSFRFNAQDLDEVKSFYKWEIRKSRSLL